MMYSVASEHDLEYSLFQYQGEDKDNLNKKKRSYRSVNKKVNLSSKQIKFFINSVSKGKSGFTLKIVSERTRE